jgi:hypothetical protein
MNRKLIAIVFGIAVLAACGIALAQNPPSPQLIVPQVPQTHSAPLTTATNPPTSNIPYGTGIPTGTGIPSVKTEPKPEDLTIDQILDAVDNIREFKAELERKEKLYLKVLHRKTEKLKERIDRMDPETTTPGTCPMPVPPVLVQPTLQTPASPLGIPTSNAMP